MPASKASNGFALLQILPMLSVVMLVVSAISAYNLTALKRAKNDNSRDLFDQVVDEISSNLAIDCRPVLGTIQNPLAPPAHIPAPNLTFAGAMDANGYRDITRLPLPSSGTSGSGVIKKNSLELNDRFGGLTITGIRLYMNQDPKYRYGIRSVTPGWLSVTATFDANSLLGSSTTTRYISLTIDPEDATTVHSCSTPGTVEDLCLLVGLPIHSDDAGDAMPVCTMNRVTMIVSMAACYNLCRYANTQPWGPPLAGCTAPLPLENNGNPDPPIPMLGVAEMNDLITEKVNPAYGGGYVVAPETAATVVYYSHQCDPTRAFNYWTGDPTRPNPLDTAFDALF